VRVPAGSQVPELEHAAEPISAFLRARTVRVQRDPGNAAEALVTIVRRDPLAQPLTDPWPWLNTGRVDLWTARVPVGIDEDGQPVTVDLIEKNLLIGGEPGAGKSVAASMLLAAAALDPAVRLLLCDGALVELAAWRACAYRFVGPDPTAFLTLLGELRAELDRRLARLLDQGQRKVHPGDGLPLVVVVIDELAFYLNTGTRKLDDQIEDALRDLVARGRKTGIIVLAATQRPSFDVVPTSIRDLFAYRWALRCTTPEASDTILGGGHATLGYSASDIPAEHRGVSWLRSEGTTPAGCAPTTSPIPSSPNSRLAPRSSAPNRSRPTRRWSWSCTGSTATTRTTSTAGQDEPARLAPDPWRRLRPHLDRELRGLRARAAPRPRPAGRRADRRSALPDLRHPTAPPPLRTLRETTWTAG
jgi:hypothetical protein